jgi:hypothetical protein
LAQQKSSFTVNMLGAAEFSFLGREDDQALADSYNHLRKELGLPSYWGILKPKHYAAAEQVSISKQQLDKLRLARARRAGAHAGEAAAPAVDAVAKLVADGAQDAVTSVARISNPEAFMTPEQVQRYRKEQRHREKNYQRRLENEQHMRYQLGL